MSIKRTSVFAANPATTRGSATRLSAHKDQVVYANGRTIVVRTRLCGFSVYPPPKVVFIMRFFFFFFGLPLIVIVTLALGVGRWDERTNERMIMVAVLFCKL